MLKVKDIDKAKVLIRIDEIEKSGRAATWFTGFDNSLDLGVSENLTLAVMKNLLKKQLISGCACGCRGDFALTEMGREFLRKAGHQI